MTKLKTPRLPVEFKSTTGIKNNKRQRLRAQLMASAFPEVRFSVANTNPLGVKRAKILGIPGAGLPHAIYQKVSGIPEQDILIHLETAYRIYRATTQTEYITYTNLAYIMQVDFIVLFQAITYLKEQDPYMVHFTVDRLGYNHAVKIVYPHKLNRKGDK